MISPLVQRQILQTATVEAVRLANEGAHLVQRDLARRHALELRQAEAADEVHDVAEIEAIKLEERSQHGAKRQGHPQDSPEEDGEAAEPAEKHLDFLA